MLRIVARHWKSISADSRLLQHHSLTPMEKVPAGEFTFSTSFPIASRLLGC